MKKVYIVHCWGGSVLDGWYPWLRKHLEINGVKVIMENMPNTETPMISQWVKKLDSLVETLDEDTYFIGHSIGCQTIMRYLQTKETIKIGGILFVTPWLDLLPKALEDGADEIAKPWINTPIDFEKVKRFTNRITAIFSSDDYFVSLEQTNIFQEKLNVHTVIVPEKGHISEEDGVYDLPEILVETGNLLGMKLLGISKKRKWKKRIKTLKNDYNDELKNRLLKKW